MRYTGPKNRLARREGVDLGLKTPGTKAHSHLLKKLAVIPGQHGTSRRKSKLTDYGIQLREKQKLKRIYGLSEKQMKNYFKKASRKVGNTADFLIQSLESRLDSVVYKLGLASTRASSRQLVAHGHIMINDKKVNIPSYKVAVGETVRLKKDQSRVLPTDVIIPSYLEFKEGKGKLLSVPTREIVQLPADIQLVVEFYSR